MPDMPIGRDANPGLDLGIVRRMRACPAGGVMGKVPSHPSAILLVVQLLGVLVYPFMEDGWHAERFVFEIFGALVLALAIWSVRESPGPTWIAVTLGVVASGLSIVDAIHPSPGAGCGLGGVACALLLLGRGQPDGLHAGGPHRHHR